MRTERGVAARERETHVHMADIARASPLEAGLTDQGLVAVQRVQIIVQIKPDHAAARGRLGPLPIKADERTLILHDLVGVESAQQNDVGPCAIV